MYVAQLIPLLVKGTFAPGSVTAIKALCDQWFRDEASLVSFVLNRQSQTQERDDA